MSAVSSHNKEITYSAHTLPVGAAFDSTTRVFTWTPSAWQVGTNNVIINATDGLTTASLSFEIKVIAEIISGGFTGESTGIFLGGQELTEIPPEGGQVNIITELTIYHQLISFRAAFQLRGQVLTYRQMKEMNFRYLR